MRVPACLHKKWARPEFLAGIGFGVRINVLSTALSTQLVRNFLAASNMLDAIDVEGAALRRAVSRIRADEDHGTFRRSGVALIIFPWQDTPNPTTQERP
jgi:hypothetical protein